MWRSLVGRYRRFGDNILFLCSRIKQSKKNVRSKWMRYHIGDGVGGFDFTGNVEDPVRFAAT